MPVLSVVGVRLPYDKQVNCSVPQSLWLMTVTATPCPMVVPSASPLSDWY